MNKLREKIRQATDMRPAALGFAAADRKRAPSLLLLGTGSKSAIARVAADVDGYLVNSSGDRPGDSVDAARGLVVHDGDLPPAGDFDFLLLDEQTPAAALLNEDFAYLMKADADMPDSLLRALHSTPVDGLLVQTGGPLTVGTQVALLRLSGFAGKPLFVELKDAPSSTDLEVLREAGVIGLVLNADLGPQRIGSLRETIEKLPPRRKLRRDDREPVAIVGQVAQSTEDDEQFDDE